MRGKRGLVMGVANDHSIAWGIAKALSEHGAELAFSYQGEAFGKRIAPLAQSLGAPLVLPCDVEDIDSVDQLFAAIEKKWGGLDFVVHSLAYSDRAGLKGRYADTTRENFLRTMLISVFSFTEIAKRAAPLMQTTIDRLVAARANLSESDLADRNSVHPMPATCEPVLCAPAAVDVESVDTAVVREDGSSHGFPDGAESFR